MDITRVMHTANMQLELSQRVVPSGIEPLPTASEAIVLSIGPRDQRVRAEGEMRNGPRGTWQGEG